MIDDREPDEWFIDSLDSSVMCVVNTVIREDLVTVQIANSFAAVVV